MRDAIVYSGWNWETFGSPERISLALAQLGCKVLHCAAPVSIFRNRQQGLREIGEGIHGLQLGFISTKFNHLPGAPLAQALMMRKRIEAAERELKLRDPIFLYAHMGKLFPLCGLMKRDHFIVHICMDHSVAFDPEYDRFVDISDKTLAIPKISFHKFKARFDGKISLIPQCGDTWRLSHSASGPLLEPSALSRVPRPRLGYLGCVNQRVNTPVVGSLLHSHPEWHFVSFGSTTTLFLPNAHVIPWEGNGEVAAYSANFDVGFMPYNCYDEDALHCVPLKLFDYFAFGIPVVSTPIVHLWEYENLVYFGETAAELAYAVKAALSEGPNSPKRAARIEIARNHSIENLATVLHQCLPLEDVAPVGDDTA